MNEIKAYERFVSTKIESEIVRIRESLGRGAGLGDPLFHAQLVGQIAGLEMTKSILHDNTSIYIKEQGDFE